MSSVKSQTSSNRAIKYPCTYCDFKASYNSVLKDHVQSIHDGIKYPCTYCEYKATQKSNLGNPLVHVDSIVVGHTIVAGQKVVVTDTKCQ